MLTPNEAATFIHARRCASFSERVPLQQAIGRILTQPIYAETDFPPFDQVRMDGIAIRFADWEGGIRSFKSVGIQRAGVPAMSLSEPASCLEVMTGSILPSGADTVIPYEDTHLSDGVFSITKPDIQAHKNIHRKGSDKQRGDLIVASGMRIGSPEIGIAASSGYDILEVKSQPRVAIVSTGDELVEIGATLLPHQIRRSNAYALRAFIQGLGVEASLHHVIDEENKLHDALESILDNHDLVILSGGVSKGKFDLVPEVLVSLGAECHFHQIAQKPGKPMWFGTRRETVIFALPGNPISTLACAARYILPWWKNNEGQEYGIQKVQVKGPIPPLKSLTLFQPAKLIWTEEAVLLGELLPWNGSGDFSALAGADGFVELVPGSNNQVCAFWPLSV